MIIGLCVELQIATEFAKLLRERKDCGDFTFSFFPDSEWHKIQIKRTLKNLDLLWYASFWNYNALHMMLVQWVCSVVSLLQVVEQARYLKEFWRHQLVFISVQAPACHCQVSVDTGKNAQS